MKELLGLQPSSSTISQYIDSLSEVTKAPKTTIPEIKSYPDVVYFNYYTLGISLVYAPTNGYKLKAGLSLVDLQPEKLILESIDIYNVPKASSNDVDKPKSLQSGLAFAAFPISPIILPITAQSKDKDGKSVERPPQLDVTSESSGKDFVKALGEPGRKGGGTGPSSGSINIWCEWSEDGLMVEFSGAQANGPHAWDTGKDAVWKVITLFRSSAKRDKR